VWNWAAGEVRIRSSRWDDQDKFIGLDIKNVSGLDDGFYAVYKDPNAAASIVRWRQSAGGPGPETRLVGNNLVYFGHSTVDWWGRNFWRRGQDRFHHPIEIELNEGGHPETPDRIPGHPTTGVALVRSPEKDYKVLLFESKKDGSRWLEPLEYPIGRGTQLSIRPLGAALVSPISIAIDILSFPFQGLGCCLSFPG
jgi:hypothetical protein